ncbi:MAG: hypothetical protein K6V36_09625 [Anaerolineae bacterium]|nr:hypothetical protein [Anaerolineae bacterium]
MPRQTWFRRLSCILVVALLFEIVGAPLATQRLLRATIERLEEAESISAESSAILNLLREAEQSLAPTAWAAPLGHDPGDTSSESGDEDDLCDQGHSGGSQVQYDGRALVLSEALGSGCESIIATYYSQYERQRILLSAWVPTRTPIERWEIHIEGWSFEGTGAQPAAWWDTTNRETGQPVPPGLYYFETVYSNTLGTGATLHPVLVRRAEDGPLGYNWSHSFQARLVPVDEDHVVLETSGAWLLFVRQRQGYYAASTPGEGKLTQQPDGSWIWDRIGADGSPINGLVSFDPHGRVTGFQDRLGNQTRLTYDAQGRLTTVTDPVGRQTRLGYDEAGHIVEVTEPAGTVWKLSYDAGNLVEIMNPLGYRWTFEYDDAHRLIARTDPRGNTTRYTYDEWGGVTSIVDPLGSITRYETAYNTEPLLVEDPSAVVAVRGTTTVTRFTADGRETSRSLYSFNDDGRVVRLELIADGGATRAAWEYRWGTGAKKGLLLAVVDPLGQVMEIEYEPGTQLIRAVRGPGSNRVYVGYSHSTQAGWLPKSIQRSSGSRVEITYDEEGLPQRVRQGQLQYWLRWTGPEAALRGLPAAIIWKWDGKGDPVASGARMVRLEYDRLGQLVALTDQLERRTTWTYDAAGRPVEVVDAMGRRTRYEYDALGRIVRQVDAAGGETVCRYDENGNLVELVDALGRSTRLGYDAKGRLVWREDPLGREVRFGWDAEDRLNWREDARGARVEFGYDGLGRLTSITFPTGKVWRITQDLLGRITEVTTPEAIWRYAYDAADQLVEATVERGGVTLGVRYRYDLEGHLTQLETTSGMRISYSYGSCGELTGVSSPLGSLSLRYETEGEIAPVLTEMRSDALRAAFTYDAGGRLTGLTYTHRRWPADKSLAIRYTYDLADNVSSRHDESGTTTYAYDALYRLTKVTDALGNTIVTEYDPLGNKTSVTDQRGNITRFTYDQSNRLLSVTDPLGHTTSHTYDLVGNRLSVTDARGGRWTCTYDDANRLITTTDPLGNVSRTEYDSVGNTVCRTDANNIATFFGYDPLNRLSSVMDALGHITGYTYDQNGNLTAVTNARGQTFSLSYDALNRLVQGTDPLGDASRRTYDPVGNVVSRTRPDGIAINYTYDANNRLTNITYPNQTGVTYAYDANGNRISMVDPFGATGYIYDNLNRLTSVTRGVYSVGYSYDPAGNITGITYPDGLQVSYSYNGLNLPVSVSDSVYSATISYDEAGNRLQEVLPNGIKVNYSYDLDDRLTDLQHDRGGRNN